MHAANLVAKKDVLHFVVFCFNINLRPVDIESTSFRCTLLGCSSPVKSQEQNGDNGKVSPKLSIGVCFCYVQIKDGFSRPQGPLIFNIKTSYRKILESLTVVRLMPRTIRSLLKFSKRHLGSTGFKPLAKFQSDIISDTTKYMTSRFRRI